MANTSSFSTFELSNYYDLLFNPVVGDTQTAEQITIVDVLRSIILEEGYFANDIVSLINTGLKSVQLASFNDSDINKVFNDSFTLIHDGVPINAVQEAKKKKKLLEILYPPGAKGTKSNPSDKTKLVLVQSHTNSVAPMVRNVNKVLLFFNSIPPVELARCSSIIDIKTKTARSSVVDGKVEAFSLFRFLNGVDTVNDKYYGSEFLNKSAYQAGLELFTSPQVLTNLDFSDPNNEKRPAPIIDPFRPLMSIENLELQSVSAGQALFHYKKGKLNIVLHDRARLGEVAEFVKPDLYSGIELTITYGWVHPDGPEVGNAYADLINSMRKTEKFRITNSSFHFSDSGEVKISLEIFSFGASEFSTLRITENDKFRQSQRLLEDLSSAISEYKKSTGLSSGTATKEVRAVQILDAAENYATQHELPDSALQLIQQVIKKIETNIKNKNLKSKEDNTKKLITELEKMFVKDGKDPVGQIEKQLRNTLDGILKEKIERLGALHIEDDPFVNHQFLNADVKKQIQVEGKQKLAKSSMRLVSFARLMAIFTGETISQVSDNFDEIQFCFYNANSRAGLARGKNLGGFLIELDLFKDLFQKEVYSKKKVNFNLEEFLQFVSTNFIDNPRSFMYGTRILYEGGNAKDPTVKLTKKATTDTAFFSTTMQEVMQGVGGEFAPAQVSFHLESIPPTSKKDGDDKDKSDDRTILRVHVFDNLATPHETQKQILASNVDNLISTMGVDQKQNEDKNTIDKLNNIFEKAVGEGLIKTSQDGTPIAVANGQAIKNFVRRTTPTITYGTNASIIKSAGLATLQEKELVTVNLQEHIRNSSLQPAGAGYGSIPMRLLPAAMDMTVIGCPLLEFAQQFFMDFNTGTTIDNLYAIVELNHNFSGNGKYETKIRWVPLDSYGKYYSLLSKVQQAFNYLKKQ